MAFFKLLNVNEVHTGFPQLLTQLNITVKMAVFSTGRFHHGVIFKPAVTRMLQDFVFLAHSLVTWTKGKKF